MKIQNIFNFGLILMISAALMLVAVLKKMTVLLQLLSQVEEVPILFLKWLLLFRVLLKLLAAVLPVEVLHRPDPRLR